MFEKSIESIAIVKSLLSQLSLQFLIISKDFTKKRNKFGAQLYQHIKENYSKEVYIKQLREVYTNAN